MSETDLSTVYRERVLAHSREPHNYGRPAQTNREAIGFNPLCGDKITVYLTVDGDVIRDVAFEGTGCAISMASASMMTDALKGTTRKESENLIKGAQQMFEPDARTEQPQLDEFRALEGVRSYPSRIKCATLAWTAAEAALHSDTNKHQVTTE